MKAILILLTLAVLSAMIFASPANPSDGKPSADPNKPASQVNAQPKGKAAPPNGDSKNSANQNSQPKQAASSKAKASKQAPPTGKGHGDNTPSSATSNKPTEKPDDKPTKRFVAFKSRLN